YRDVLDETGLTFILLVKRGRIGAPAPRPEQAGGPRCHHVGSPSTPPSPPRAPARPGACTCARPPSPWSSTSPRGASPRSRTGAPTAAHSAPPGPTPR